MAKKYMGGDRIKDLSELVELLEVDKAIWWAPNGRNIGRYMTNGWLQNWQLRLIKFHLKHGSFYKVEKIEEK